MSHNGTTCGHRVICLLPRDIAAQRKKNRASNNLNSEINVVCCVACVEIQIEIYKGWCTTNIESHVFLNSEINVVYMLRRQCRDTNRNINSWPCITDIGSDVKPCLSEY